MALRALYEAGYSQFQFARLLSRRDLECLLFGAGICCTSLPIIGPFADGYYGFAAPLGMFRKEFINFIIIIGRKVFVKKRKSPAACIFAAVSSLADSSPFMIY